MKTKSKAPPFRKGDWIATVPTSVSFVGTALHQAVADPRESDRCSCGWTYRALTYPYEIGADHFTKATKDDLLREMDRLNTARVELATYYAALYRASETMS